MQDERVISLGRAGRYQVRVSAEDFDALSRWKWNWKKSRGGKIYARRGGGRTNGGKGEVRPTVLMHVYVLETLMGEPRPSPEHTPDHKDRDSLNNTRGNLEWATPSEQNKNRTLPQRKPKRRRPTVEEIRAALLPSQLAALDAKKAA